MRFRWDPKLDATRFFLSHVTSARQLSLGIPSAWSPLLAKPVLLLVQVHLFHLFIRQFFVHVLETDSPVAGEHWYKRFVVILYIVKVVSSRSGRCVVKLEDGMRFMEDVSSNNTCGATSPRHVIPLSFSSKILFSNFLSPDLSKHGRHSEARCAPLTARQNVARNCVLLADLHSSVAPIHKSHLGSRTE